jgi:DNA-binding NtrC family response regulator
MLGRSPAFTDCWKSIQKFACHDAAVLICGETGTGKELAARALHYLGKRTSGPFLPVNCGAIPDNLLESEFFGHQKGAFTDARDLQIGLIEQAAGGTLFLDEVEALSHRGQTVLLRFLQDYHFRSVGGRREQVADVRIIAATNVELSDLVDRGLFRRDLMYRLKALLLMVPPLRARQADIALIAEALLTRWSAEASNPTKRLSLRASIMLEQHDWPGNIRELENVLLSGFLAAEHEEIAEEHFGNLLGVARDCTDSNLPSYQLAKQAAVESFEQTYLRQLMRMANGNITKAAQLSRQHRTALSKLLKKHGVTPLA